MMTRTQYGAGGVKAVGLLYLLSGLALLPVPDGVETLEPEKEEARLLPNSSSWVMGHPIKRRSLAARSQALYVHACTAICNGHGAGG